MVEYNLLAPPRELAGYVRFLFDVRSQPNEGSHYIFRTMANGWPILFVHHCGFLREASLQGQSGSPIAAGLFGASETTRRFWLSKDFGITGICLYPFAVRQLLNFSSSDVANELVDISHFFDVIDGDAIESICCSEQHTERMQILAELVRSKLRPLDTVDKKFTRAFSSLAASKGRVSVTSLADENCLSRRTFERRFREFSGLSPKAYSSIIRFQSAFDELTAANASLTEIAYECGYYDQSHFTNDFTRFSGFNPKNFTTDDPYSDPLWLDFVAFFQFLSWCPPVLCSAK